MQTLPFGSRICRCRGILRLFLRRQRQNIVTPQIRFCRRGGVFLGRTGGCFLIGLIRLPRQARLLPICAGCLNVAFRLRCSRIISQLVSIGSHAIAQQRERKQECKETTEGLTTRSVHPGHHGIQNTRVDATPIASIPPRTSVEMSHEHDHGYGGKAQADRDGSLANESAGRRQAVSGHNPFPGNPANQPRQQCRQNCGAEHSAQALCNNVAKPPRHGSHPLLKPRAHENHYGIYQLKYHSFNANLSLIKKTIR